MKPETHSLKTYRWIATLAATMLLIAGGQTYAAANPDVPSPSAPAARAAPAPAGDTLGAGDTVRITVFQYPDLTTETRVSARGTIAFPLIGDVVVSGLTPSAAAARIAEELRKGQYMVNPQVTVVMNQLRSRQVSVLGQVVRPGRYALEDANPKLTEILALAGGMSPTGADRVTVVLMREGQKRTLEIDVPAMVRSGDMSQNIEIQNGDTIYVHRAPVFYIYGEVQRAGAYRLEDNMTVMQALSLGGGLTDKANDRGLKINRRMPDGRVQRFDAKLTDRVQSDDVIYAKDSLF
jgi:polysaccharide export outer membrane protein